ncbi:hypothetical protein C2138_03105 [Salinibacterium hongtaonis]|nr:hypothetical protein C2138_03105 [Salinibacterium hongtaonis]
MRPRLLRRFRMLDKRSASLSTLRRVIASAVVLLVAAPVLSACVGIPRAGAVFVGDEVSQKDPGGIEYIVDGPGEDDSVEEILRGFINAFKSSGDYDVARQFLSSEFVNDWDPRESVLLHTGASRFVPVTATAMDFVLTPSASVDAAGAYRSFTAAPATLHYEFVQEDGQWRISSAPNGIVLTLGSFQNAFSRQVLYFLDTGGNYLVPDLRWFPVGTAATRVVSAVLAGPPPWLQGAATTSFPEGTQLSSPKRVAVDGQSALIDLTPEALAASEAQRQLMRLQLEASLGRVSSISSVVMSVNGSELPVGEPVRGLPQARLQVDSRPLMLHDGVFGYFANGTVTEIEGLSDRVVALAPRAATLGSSESVAAVLGVDGVSVVRRQGSPTLVDSRTDLVAPSLDGYGYVWSAQRGSTNSLQVLGFGGEQFAFTSNLPVDGEVVGIEVSRDGSRLAILLKSNGGPRLIVSAIIRDTANGQAPLSLGVPILDAVEESGTAVGLAWVDETTVATLVDSGARSAVQAYQVGGFRSPLGSADAAVGIVGANGESGLRIIGADGIVSVRRPSGWQSTQAEASFIATQR